MLICKKINSIRVKMMAAMTKKRTKIRKWKNIIYLVMHNKLQAAMDEGRIWRIRLSAEDSYEVECELSIHVKNSLRWCSCGKWKHNRFPCCHAVTMLNSSSQ